MARIRRQIRQILHVEMAQKLREKICELVNNLKWTRKDLGKKYEGECRRTTTRFENKG